MRYIYLIFIGVLISCSERKSKCVFTQNDLLDLFGNKVFSTSVDDNNIPKEFRDKGIDSVRGGYYTFYRNGNLKSYDFLLDNKTTIYTEQYDSLGNLMFKNGHPLIRFSGQRKGNDLIMKFHFFALRKEYRNVQIHVVDQSANLDTLDIDSLYSNSKVANTIFHDLPFNKDLKVKIKATYNDICQNVTITFSDTLILKN